MQKQRSQIISNHNKLQSEPNDTSAEKKLNPNQSVQGNEFLASLYGNVASEYLPPQIQKKPKNYSIRKNVTEVDTHNSVSMIFPKILNSINDTQKYINGLNATNNSSIYALNQSQLSKSIPVTSRLRQNMGTDAIKENEDLKGYIKKMQETIYITPQDKYPPEYRGDESSNHYFKHYKKIDRIVQENSFFNVGESPQTIMLSNQENNGLLPSKLGIIQERDDLQSKRPKLKLKNMSYGDNYIDVLGKSIKKIQIIKDFELKGNRITKNSSAAILSSINQQALSIDLSNNRIGTIGCSHLSKFMSIRETCKLEYLNLEENYLGNIAVIDLLKGVEFNRTLKYLNLSKNYLSDEISDYLKNFLERGVLKELYLHWNLLKYQFGQMLFTCLNENDNLVVLDLSNNSLGKGELQCTGELCEFLKTNVALIHLDLSYNYFDYINSQTISTALETNKTIYGFHFVGNCGYVDTRGFLVPEQITQELTGSLSKTRIHSLKMVHKNVREDREQYIRDACWICEGWVERTFQWQKKASGDQDVDCLFIHFNFEDYMPCFHGKQDSQIIKYTRMVPQGPLKYFYSNSNSDFFFDQKQKKYNKSVTLLKDVLNSDKTFVDVDLKNMNYELLDIHNHAIIDEEFVPQIATKPRTRDPIYVPPKKKKKRVIWTFPTSLMYKWRMDDAELINLCFEYDWECCKVPKIIKDPEQLANTKEFFRERYKFIKDTYKNFASSSPVSDIWAIQNSAFFEIIDQCQILDSKVTMEFINIKWTAVISGIKGQIMLPAFSVLSGKKDQFGNILVQSVDNRDNRLSLNNINITQTNLQILQEVKQEDQEDKEQEGEDQLDTTQKNQTPQEQVEKIEPINRNKVESLSNIPSGRDSVPRLSLNFQTDKKLLIANYNKHLAALQQLPCDAQSLQSGKNQRNPERGVNRYQMMELIVRIAEEKYVNKYQKTKNLFEAVQFLWEGKKQQYINLTDNLNQVFTKAKYDSQTWRNDRYFNEDCDYCLKNYKRIIDYIYKKYSVKKVKPGQQPFMCLDELNAIVVQAGLAELEWFGSTNYLYAFNLSMMTQIDELGTDRIFQMSQVEFYEAVARLAEEASLPPLEGVYTEEEVCTLEKKMRMPLGHKIEGLIVRLFDTCCDPGFKASYPKLTSSFFKKANDDSDYE